jgi:probable HAF family extracellular repeat protein
VLTRLAHRLQKLVTPKTAYAVDVGLGGLSFDMSPFNVLDTLSSPDLAVQSVSVAPASVHGGDHLTLSYSVTNIGTASRGTSHATLFLTPVPPTGYEGPPLADQPLGGAFDVPPVAAQATVTRTDIDVLVPPGVSAGAYLLKLVIDDDPQFPEASTANNAASATLTIAPANITNLGVLTGYDASVGLAINAAGHVVGYSSGGTSAAPTAAPFFWQGGVMTPLGNLGGNFAWATGINSADEVVGVSTIADGSYHAFRWKSGTMTDLGTLPLTTQSFAVGITSTGDVVGYSVAGIDIGTARAWIWQNGVMTELVPFEGATGALPTAVNASGQIVGLAQTASGTRGWIFQNQIMTPLATLGGVSYPRTISDNGLIAGVSEVTDGAARPVRWTTQGIEDIGLLPADTQGYAEGISDDGRIVGLSYSYAGQSGFQAHAFLWRAGHMIDLGTLGGSFGEALAINNSGQIVGQSTTADGKGRATLWQAPASP